MFGNDPSNRKPSLLTLADRDAGAVQHAAQNENVVELNGGTDSVSTHRRARAARRSNNPILNALGDRGGSHGTSSNHDEALQSIERDVDAIIGNGGNYQREIVLDDQAYRPLIDPVIMADAIWRWRWPIAGATLLGGAAGVLIALGTPNVYTAYSQVLIDPRQVKLVERDLTPEFLGNESALAIVDSQLQSVYSTPVLQGVIDKLSLNQDGEFNGTNDSGIGLLDGIAFVRSLFSDETPVDTSERLTIENLREAISAERTSRTFVFTISAESQNQRRAAQIANAVTESFIENQTQREAQAARSASDALDGQLVSLKAAVENAEREAEAFAQANNLTRVEGLTLTDNALVATSAQLSEAKAATIEAKSIAEAAQNVSVDSVVNGALPPELVNSALTTFRAQFSSLSQNAASLEQALGPRHPRLTNAIAAREAARQEIAAELQRIVAGTQADLRRAIRNEQQIAAALAETRAEKGQSGDALITLRDLEAEIEAAQSIYKAALLRSRETNQLENLVSVNATIISKAEPPLTPSSLSRKVIAVSGALAGLMIGLGLAFVAGLRDCMNAQREAPSRNPTPSGGSRHIRQQTSADNKPYALSNSVMNSHAAATAATANSENEMYSNVPYYPYAPTQQPQAQSPGYVPQAYGHPAQVQPQAPVPPQSGGYGQSAPMNFGPAPMQTPNHVQPPMQGYPSHVPMPNPGYPQFAHYPAPQQAAPQPQPPIPSYEEELELNELRASLQEIREVVDHLAQTRSARRRFG